MSTHRNDDKLSALETLTGSTGHIDDLENEWLLSEITTPVSVHVNDLWLELFIEKGVSATNINDAAYEWLGDLGYTGALADRWAAYWAAGGGSGSDNVINGANNVISGGNNVIN